MHYFKYQHKVQMIPYIEQQLQQYLKDLSKKLPHLSNEQRVKIKNMLNRKLKKIEEFYADCYVDYRAPLILRARGLLCRFLVEFAQWFPGGGQEEREKEVKMEKVDKVKEEKVKIVEKMNPRPTESRAGEAAIKNMKSSLQKSKEKDPKKQQSPKAAVKISLQRARQKQRASPIRVEIHQVQSIKSPKNGGQEPKVIRRTVTETSKKITKDEYIQYLKNKQKS